MKKQACVSRNPISIMGMALALFLALLPVPKLYASDQSDAEMLRDKCDREFAELQIPARNFGDQADLEKLNDGALMIKLAKVKMLQTKFLEASEQFNRYLALQQSLYASLANKYVARTGAMADQAAVDLVDSGNPKVMEYLGLANQNLRDAKSEIAASRFKNAIMLCRVSKNYSISAYRAAGKTVPGDYGKDTTDNDNKLAQ